MDDSMVPIVAAAIGALGAIVAAITTVLGGRLRIQSTLLIGLAGVILLSAIVGILWIVCQDTVGPSARIVRPGYGDGPIVFQTSVVVNYDRIPKGRYLWVVVRVPKVTPDWVVFPQLLSGMPTPVEGAGTYETTIQLGDSQKDIGDPFNIVVLLLDENANHSFVEYSKNCLKLGTCGGILLPNSGAQVLDFNTVIRK